MQEFNIFLNYFKASDRHEIHSRQYRLIRYISFELITVCVVVICLYSISKLWYMVITISTGTCLILINLSLLNRTSNTKLCGHIMTLTTFVTITLANYLVWGVGSFHSQWFYVIPLIAASLIGRTGLIIYSILSLLMIIGSNKFALPPFYHIPAYRLITIEWINHLFAYLILVTILVNLIDEHEHYEQILHDKNYLLHAKKERYRYLARFDQLTNLPNRRYFRQHLNEIINSLASGYCATVFFIDLDSFKYVNDCYGHNIGDRVLLETSRRLQRCFRDGDFIARLGGDEFTAIVLHVQNEKIPEIIAQRIVHEFSKPFQFENLKFFCSISIGLATYPQDSLTVSDLIVKADRAMYTAKKINGSAYCKATVSIA